MSRALPRDRRRPLACGFGMALATAALALPVTAQETPTAWIHLSESPVFGAGEQKPLDRYIGVGPELHAFLVTDEIPGGYVSAFECGVWLDIEDSSIQVGEFVPSGQWRHDDSPPNAFERWPAIPGEPLPAVLRYWPVRLLRGFDSRGRIGLAPDSSAGILEPLALTGTGRAAPILLLRGAAINTEAPLPWSLSPDQTAPQLFWVPGDNIKDLSRFPNVGVLRLKIPYPGAIRWGELGMTVRDEHGPLGAVEFPLGSGGGRPEEGRGWVEAPSGDATWRQCGHLGFRHPDGRSAREILIDIPVRVGGPPRPLTVGVPWISLETPLAGRDTVWTTQPEAEVTALGGVDPLGYVVHTWSPARTDAGRAFRIAFVGDGLDRVRGVRLEDGNARYDASRISAHHQGRALWADFADGVTRPGLYRIGFEAPPLESGLAPKGRLIVAGDDSGPEGGDPEPPWWMTCADTITADYVIVASTVNNIHEAAEELGRSRIEVYSPHRTVCITLPEIRDAFPASPDTCAIRSALRFAYENWCTAPVFALLVGTASEEAPEHNLIPTPHACDGKAGGWNDCTYAIDWWYGDVFEGAEDVREIVVGRLPAWIPTVPYDYGQKLAWHALQSPLYSTVAVVVGDADNLGAQDNSSRRSAAQRIMSYIKSAAPLDTMGIYSRDYAALHGNPDVIDDPEEVEVGRNAVIDLLDNTTPGIVEFSGNTFPANEVTHLLCYDDDGPWIRPQFRTNMLETGSIWPLALFSHCKVGAFDEYSWDWAVSPIADFVVWHAAGPVVALGKGAMSFFEADEEISRRVYEEILEGGGGAGIGYQVNGALEKYMASLECSRPEQFHDARSINIVGDPSVVLKLDVVPTKLTGSFEAWGAVPLQNRLAARSEWVSGSLDVECSSARLAHGGYQEGPCGYTSSGQILPLAGERMLRLWAKHDQGPDKKAAWTVFWQRPCALGSRPLVRLSQANAGNVVLRFWRYQDLNDQIESEPIVDLITSDGRVLSDFATEACYDEDGEPYDGRDLDCPLHWNHVWVRLDSWAAQGAEIESVVVRYERVPQDFGFPLVSCVDEVYVGGWTSGTLPIERNVVLDGDFVEDANEDSRPDFWNGPDALLWDGGVVLDSGADFPWIKQLMPTDTGEGAWLVDFRAAGSADSAHNHLAVRLVDLEDPGVAQERLFDVSSAWSRYTTCLRGNAGHHHFLEFELTRGIVQLDSVSAAVRTGVEVPGADALERTGPIVELGPCPSHGALTLRLAPSLRGPAGLEVFDVGGRRLISTIILDACDGLNEIDLRDMAGGRLRSGVYWLRVSSGSMRHQTRLVVVP